MSKRGTQHHDAKLDPERVREMRRLYGAGVLGPELVRRFGMSKRAVYAVLNYETWKLVD